MASKSTKDAKAIICMSDYCDVLYKGPGGVIVSQNYPNEYENDLECGNNITCPVGELIDIEFNAWDVEYFDELWIVDGALHTKLNGDPYLGKTNEAYLVFETDYSIVHSGWSLNYSCVQTEKPYPVFFWPLNGYLRGKDIGGYAVHSFTDNLEFAEGVGGIAEGSITFTTNAPYLIIDMPSDTISTFSVTLLVYPEASSSVNHVMTALNNQGEIKMKINIFNNTDLDAIFFFPSGDFKLSARNAILLQKWIFVVLTYDINTQVARLWVNGVPVIEGQVGSLNIQVKRIVVSNDRYPFNGRISCLQIYEIALNSTHVRKAGNLCNGTVGATRLVGHTSDAGQVEIFYNNTWAKVCRHPDYDMMNFLAAQVVCMGLGLDWGQVTTRAPNEIPENLSQPSWLRGVDCNSLEVSLAECKHSPWELELCSVDKVLTVSCFAFETTTQESSTSQLSPIVTTDMTTQNSELTTDFETTIELLESDTTEAAMTTAYETEAAKMTTIASDTSPVESTPSPTTTSAETTDITTEPMETTYVLVSTVVVTTDVLTTDPSTTALTTSSAATPTTSTASAGPTTAAQRTAESTSTEIATGPLSDESEQSVIGVRAETCTSWTAWFDKDNPLGNYDREDLADLQTKHPGQICATPVGIHARVHGTRMGALLTGELFEAFGPTSGIVCKNSDQADGICEDYEARYCCETSNVCRTFATNRGLSDTFNNPPASSPVKFKVQATYHVNVLLSSRNYWMPEKYIITIGNTHSLIRKNDWNRITAEVLATGFLSPTQYKGFWISWTLNGTIAVGREGDVTPFMQFSDPDPLPIRFVGFRTWKTEYGSLEICDEECSTVSPNVGLALSYNMTKFPNYAGHQNESELRSSPTELEAFRTLANDNCHPHIRHLVFSIVVPQCVSGRTYPPCYEFCRRVRKSCVDVIGASVVKNLFWCVDFPRASEVVYCVDPESLWREDGRCGTVFPAPGATVAQCHPEYFPCCTMDGWCEPQSVCTDPLVPSDGGTMEEYRRWETGEALPESYNAKESPIDMQKGKLLPTSSGVKIDSFGWLSEETMNFNVTATFTVAWTDPRLANLGGRTWIPVPAHVLWLPSVKFGKKVRASWYVISRSSQGKGTRDEEGTMTTWLSPDGQISHSIRRKLSVFCRLDLRSYPFDKQTCSLQLQGFGGIVFQISRVPGGRSPMVLDLTEADSQFVLRETELLGTVASKRQDGIGCTFFHQRCMLGKSADTCPYLRFCDTRDPVCGSPDVYSTIEVRFHFQRRLPYYVLQTFIPTTTVVVVSWSSFWIHFSEASARVAIGSTTLLMLIRLGSQTMRMPHISYIRAIDIWHIGCLVFALLVTLEFAVVHFLHSTDGKKADIKKHWKNSARRRRSRVEPVQFIEERMADEVSKKDDEPKTRVKLTKSTTERPTTGGNKRSADRKISARGRKAEKARPVRPAKVPVGVPVLLM
ncbi:PREDICTED: uncharacterized protein LOC109469067 [Branchiostoma belcheri]|uniref:Uncharacterized protein LOC109469067 n=1 Tax=Branchiostoma belcheri TaxID=7741 RepID=A0A6P4YW97_BRABE|nr:PREDICTED: uncharacterized protein LOC109469067 [Branchiostoma belcheri]